LDAKLVCQIGLARLRRSAPYAKQLFSSGARQDALYKTACI